MIECGLAFEGRFRRLSSNLHFVFLRVLRGSTMTCPTEVGPIEGLRKLSGIRENYREIRWIGLSKILSGAKLQMWPGLADL